MEKKGYRIKGWIPVEIEREVMTEIEAQDELEHLRGLQPENRYELEGVIIETGEGLEDGEKEKVAEALELIDGGYYSDAIVVLNKLMEEQWQGQFDDINERLGGLGKKVK